METDNTLTSRIYRHTYRGLCFDGMEPPVPFFDAIDRLLIQHCISDKDTQKIRIDHPYCNQESSINVYVADGLTVVDERHMMCRTPPHKLKSYEADSYDCSVLVHLLYRPDKEEQAQALLTDLRGLNKSFPGV